MTNLRLFFNFLERGAMMMALRVVFSFLFCAVFAVNAFADADAVLRQLGNAVIGVEQNSAQSRIAAERQKEQVRISAERRRAGIEARLSENERRYLSVSSELFQSETELRRLQSDQRRRSMYSEREYLTRKEDLQRKVFRTKDTLTDLREQHLRMEGQIEDVNADEDAQIAGIDAHVKASEQGRAVHEGTGVANQILRGVLGR